MENEENEQFVLEDGRKAEKTVVENKVGENESYRVIEIKAEEARPLKIQQRITEKMKSYLHERVIETLDQETGEVINTKVETFDCITGAVKESNGEKKRSKLSSLGAVEEAELVQEKSFNTKSLVLTVIIVAQVLGLAYLIFWR